MASHPRYEISPDKGGKLRFNLTAKNGQVVLSSQGYASRAGCLNGIESVRKNCGNDSAYDRNESTDGKHYFNLLAANKQVIGTSQRYASKASMEKGIDSVKANGKAAQVHEG